jgi:hypothetical protein
MSVILFQSPEMIIFPSIKATLLLVVVRMVFLVVSFDLFIEFLPQFAKRSSSGTRIIDRLPMTFRSIKIIQNSCMTLAGFASVRLECHAQPVPMTKVIQQTAIQTCVTDNILLACFSDEFSHSSSMMTEFQIHFQSLGDMIGKMNLDS